MDIRTIIILLGCILHLGGDILAQNGADAPADTSKLLPEAVVNAYRYGRPMSEVPASITVVDETELHRFNNTSILSTVNTVPGVRMEERSPGSYRFSIRGSLLRSPFGVRNVKIYWNGLPMTDGGGNTYLNLLDFNAITNAEIVKGPGASLYGAGTGGVVLLHKSYALQPQLQFSSVIGSYGLQRYQTALQAGTKKVRASIQFAHQQADGYRTQAAMRRDALNADVRIALNAKSTLSTTLFYTDLFYETPGGLTLAQFEEDPRQARPGAEATMAAVKNKSGYGGILFEHNWNPNWITTAGLYGSSIQFRNPSIRNYESREETNVGGRTDTQYSFEKERWKGKLTFGGEYQYFFSPVQVFDNNGGSPGSSIEADDELTSRQFLLFAQAEFELPRGFFLTVGGSANFLTYDFSALLTPPVIAQKREFDPVFSPRVALLKKLGTHLSIFASFSKGFSPPSLAEVRPSTGTYNNALNPEQGISVEGGFRGNAAGKQLQFDFTVYDFKLDETIVIQRAEDGAEFFVNAGKTSQRGIETKVSWTPDILSQNIKRLNFWITYTYNHYRFVDYVQDGDDFSGNRLTGVAPTIAIFGLDLGFRHLYGNFTAGFTDAIPLNDANSAYADSYMLLGARIGYKASLGNSTPIDVFAGIDNALDERYSLGNDLNAFGGRYYNGAARRNFYIGITLTPYLRKGR
jgi:iron complex outermembrane receptor protein